MIIVDASINNLARWWRNLFFELLENDGTSPTQAEPFGIFAIRGVVGISSRRGTLAIMIEAPSIIIYEIERVSVQSQDSWQLHIVDGGVYWWSILEIACVDGSTI